MTTLSISEGDATFQPRLGLPNQAVEVDFEAAVWRRLESWISWRWGARDCVFIAEGGCGSWRPPLTPFTVETVEAWQTSDSQATVELRPHPLGGYVLEDASHYRFSGTVGTDAWPPPDVLEAYRRLGEYFAKVERHHGASSFTIDLGGKLKRTEDRAPIWLARAMSYSGAADLLRPYRRAL